jgi:HEAT repeat protein
LIQCLQDESLTVRRWAALALGEIGPTAPAAIPALIEALREDDVKNRAVSAAALAKMGSRAVPRLVDALKHKDPKVRRHAALTLGKSPRGRDAIDELVKAARDPDPEVRAAAIESLRRLNPNFRIPPG